MVSILRSPLASRLSGTALGYPIRTARSVRTRYSGASRARIDAGDTLQASGLRLRWLNTTASSSFRGHCPLSCLAAGITAGLPGIAGEIELRRSSTLTLSPLASMRNSSGFHTSTSRFRKSAPPGYSPEMVSRLDGPLGEGDSHVQPDPARPYEGLRATISPRATLHIPCRRGPRARITALWETYSLITLKSATT